MGPNQDLGGWGAVGVPVKTLLMGRISAITLLCDAMMQS